MSTAGNPYGQTPQWPPVYPPHAGFPPPPPPRRRGMPVWAWVLIVLALLAVLSCAGFIGFAAYIGAKGPGTKVYLGHEVPKKFVDLANELKLLDEGEKIKFFFSDAMTDPREGMYFVTDKKVVIYIAESATPATIVPFEDIYDAELQSTDSWLEDGSITLHLKDGSVLVFPVSSEGGRDELMFDAIEVAPDEGQSEDEPHPQLERDDSPATASG